MIEIQGNPHVPERAGHVAQELVALVAELRLEFEKPDTAYSKLKLQLDPHKLVIITTDEAGTMIDSWTLR